MSDLGAPPRWFPLATLAAVLVAPPVLFVSFLRVPGGVLPWASLCLLGAAALGQFMAGSRPLTRQWREALGRTWALAALVTGAQLFVGPEPLLFLLSGGDALYSAARAIGGMLVVGAAVGVVRDLPRALGRRPEPPARPRPGESVVAQLRAGAVNRAADLLRCALLCGLALLCLLASGAFAGWAFWEGWVALALVWFLLGDIAGVAWQREDARAVLRDAERPAASGQARWRAAAAGWAVAVTASFTVWTAGLRPTPWPVLGVLALTAALLTFAPASLLPGREDAVLRRWLDAVPGRRAEVEAWPEASGGQGTPFGELP